jgi:zinc D-Ala-D-Ala carboxypeptidase
MANLTTSQTTAYLRELGFRIRTSNERNQQIVSFKKGWNLGPALTVNATIDAAFSAALRKSIARKRAGLPTASAHFGFREFECKCGGRYSNCMRIKIIRAELQSLEKYRIALGRGVRIKSGYRCPGHNEDVGGARYSQHMYGGSADIEPLMDEDTLRAKRLFAGIGYVQSSDRAAHVDRRDKTGHNTTGGTLSNPTRWPYYH